MPGRRARAGSWVGGLASRGNELRNDHYVPMLVARPTKAIVRSSMLHRLHQQGSRRGPTFTCLIELFRIAATQCMPSMSLWATLLPNGLQVISARESGLGHTSDWDPADLRPWCRHSDIHLHSGRISLMRHPTGWCYQGVEQRCYGMAVLWWESSIRGERCVL